MRHEARERALGKDVQFPEGATLGEFEVMKRGVGGCEPVGRKLLAQFIKIARKK
jgi:hypothetical protein